MPMLTELDCFHAYMSDVMVLPILDAKILPFDPDPKVSSVLNRVVVTLENLSPSICVLKSTLDNFCIYFFIKKMSINKCSVRKKWQIVPHAFDCFCFFALQD